MGERAIVNIPFAAGPVTDSQFDGAAVVDTDNVENLPDGSGVYNRRGSVVFQTLSPSIGATTTNSYGRSAQALVVNGTVPGLSEAASLYAIVNCGNGNSVSSVSHSIFDPQLSEMPNGDYRSKISFGSYDYAYVQDTVRVVVKRDEARGPCTFAYAWGRFSAVSDEGSDWLLSGDHFDADDAIGTITMAIGQKYVQVLLPITASDYVHRKIECMIIGSSGCFASDMITNKDVTTAYGSCGGSPILVSTIMASSPSATSDSDDNGRARSIRVTAEGAVEAVYFRCTRPGQAI